VCRIKQGTGAARGTRFPRVYTLHAFPNGQVRVSAKGGKRTLTI